MITAVASWSTALTAQAFRLTAKVAVDKLRETEPDRISPYCEFDFKYGCSRRTDGCEGVAVTLSEYWICDHVRNEDCDPEYLIQRDAPLVQQFADELQRLLGDHFEVEAYCRDR